MKRNGIVLLTTVGSSTCGVRSTRTATRTTDAAVQDDGSSAACRSDSSHRRLVEGRKNLPALFRVRTQHPQ
jgi:hypothetical protein